jgi:hypothetical protein
MAHLPIFVLSDFLSDVISRETRCDRITVRCCVSRATFDEAALGQIGGKDTATRRRGDSNSLRNFF